MIYLATGETLIIYLARDRTQVIHLLIIAKDTPFVLHCWDYKNTNKQTKAQNNQTNNSELNTI